MRNVINWIALILLVVGGLNWGLIGLLDFDLIAELFGAMTTATKIIYSLVGVSAIWVLIARLMK